MITLLGLAALALTFFAGYLFASRALANPANRKVGLSVVGIILLVAVLLMLVLTNR